MLFEIWTEGMTNNTCDCYSTPETLADALMQFWRPDGYAVAGAYWWQDWDERERLMRDRDFDPQEHIFIDLDEIAERTRDAGTARAMIIARARSISEMAG